MRIARSMAAVAALSLAVASPALAEDTVDRTPAAVADGPASSYIVQFTPGSDRAAEVSKAKALGMTVTYEYTTALSGMAVQANAGQVRALQANPNVRLVETDKVATLSDTQTTAPWGLDRIDQRALPLSTTYTFPASKGAGVTAYVIDTGILATHTDLGGRVSGGTSFVNDGRGTSDCNGHGTHVAGTIGGNTYGVAKAVSLVPVRVFGCTGGAAYSSIIAAVDWVAANATLPAVVNMSLGGPADTALNTAVANATGKGIAFAVAAGNETADACTKSPASTPVAITVGATTSTDAQASYSNFGSCLDIYAPGSSITSAWYTSTTATNTISGTSMATPHVAGAAALYLSANPSATPQVVRDALVSAGTTGKVTSISASSPNVLLYVDGGSPAINTPTITSLSPTSGAIGASVTIGGTNLSGATSVRFNGTSATEFTVVSATQITARVPAGATTGAVSVATPNGTATGPSFTVLTAPPAPTNVRASAGTKGTASVSWTQASNGGSAIQKSVVTVIRVSATGAVPMPVTITGTGTSARFSGLTKGATYRFSVVATNSIGDSQAGTSGTITAR